VTEGKQDPLELLHYTNFDDETKDELVWRVARATTAAPGYFKKFIIDEKGPLFDGGLTANNPTLTALSFIVNKYQVCH
jgi:patatin-like phospholipase/acyl hydrolase